jgi:hypothetical protein
MDVHIDEEYRVCFASLFADLAEEYVSHSIV